MTESLNPPQLGLEVIANLLNEEDYLYLLRALYRMVLHAARHRQSASRLRHRLRRFEQACELPPVLSALPMNQFLSELELEQYFYPICSREILFTRFNEPLE